MPKTTMGYQVDKAELEKVDEEIYQLLQERFGNDDEDDPNVEFILIDRERYWKMPFFQVEYDFKEPRPALEAALTNLSIASGEVERMLRMRRYDEVLKTECCEANPEGDRCSQCGCLWVKDILVKKVGEIPAPDAKKILTCQYHFYKQREMRGL